VCLCVASESSFDGHGGSGRGPAHSGALMSAEVHDAHITASRGPPHLPP
jgi:hypothetical protein